VIEPEQSAAASSSRLRPGFYVVKTDGGMAADQGLASGQAAIGAVLKDPEYAM
jgi:hypothetical protein